MTPDLYFAYGSNLSSKRLLARVPSARARGVARLDGLTLTLDKRGSDGSGKANLRPDASAFVWGVVYGLPPSAWEDLDVYEGGYERLVVEVECGEAWLMAQTYVSARFTDDPVAFDWYKGHIVDGAREHGLPEHWIARLVALPARRGGEPTP